ncbi:MAG: UDP-N-acetylmuramoyl-tripeptide--D-alanyl-D-alanine ligase [Planctomycetota bacterium]|jgi:UDP-N-acetylmuramoyl-tripeptide--D-alanyl-D-alanine ligase
MKPVTIDILAKVLDADVLSHGTADESICGVSIDSRTIQAGDCFFAVKGENFDGHDYLEQAFAKGAACAVVERDAEANGNILKVADVIKALGELAGWYRGEMGFRVAAITGSAGKTTTREMVYQVLSRHFSCVQSPKSFNNAVGLPLTILSADEGHEIVIAELGSNAPGEIAHLAAIAAPDVAMVTNIYPAHLAGFGDIETIIKEKASIAEGLKASGTLLINGDFEELVRYCSTVKRDFLTFGEGPGCDIRGEQLVSEGTKGWLQVEGQEIPVPLAGRASLLNALGAWAICKQFDISTEDFAEAISTFEAVDMRLKVKNCGPITVIDDSYNANPASMANALDCLVQVGTGQRKVFICGLMAELGPYSEQMHHQLGQLVADSGIEVLAAVGDFADVVARAAREKNGDKDFEIFLFKNTNELCNNLSKFVRRADIVLVKGSRSAKLNKAVQKLNFLKF